MKELLCTCFYFHTFLVCSSYGFVIFCKITAFRSFRLSKSCHSVSFFCQTVFFWHYFWNVRINLVIDYLGRQYVVELKIWRGNSYNERGEQQLKEYLDYFRVQEGYLLSFCFNKNKQPGIQDVTIGDRTICEAVV